jgi:hypothetical protein
MRYAKLSLPLPLTVHDFAPGVKRKSLKCLNIFMDFEWMQQNQVAHVIELT